MFGPNNDTKNADNLSINRRRNNPRSVYNPINVRRDATKLPPMNDGELLYNGTLTPLELMIHFFRSKLLMSTSNPSKVNDSLCFNIIQRDQSEITFMLVGHNTPYVLKSSDDPDLFDFLHNPPNNFVCIQKLFVTTFKEPAALVVPDMHMERYVDAFSSSIQLSGKYLESVCIIGNDNQQHSRHTYSLAFRDGDPRIPSLCMIVNKEKKETCTVRLFGKEQNHHQWTLVTNGYIFDNWRQIVTCDNIPQDNLNVVVVRTDQDSFVVGVMIPMRHKCKKVNPIEETNSNDMDDGNNM